MKEERETEIKTGRISEDKMKLIAGCVSIGASLLEMVKKAVVNLTIKSKSIHSNCPISILRYMVLLEKY